MSAGPLIPFGTLSERHLVYAYCVVWLLQFGYGGRLLYQWLSLRKKSNGAR